jgi:hypothetical protein
MPSLGLVSEDVLVPVTIKESVVVQVEQLTALSPMAEPQEMDSLGAPASEAKTPEVEISQDDIRPVVQLKERKTNEANVRKSRTSLSPRLQRSTSLGSLKPDRKGHGVSPRRKDIGLRLPSFRGLGISSLEPRYLTRSGHAEGQHLRSEVLSQTQRPGLRPRPSSIYHHASEPHFGSTPLLTPPEDTSSIKWNNALLHPSSSNNSRCKQHGTHCNHTNGITSVSMGDNTSGHSSSLSGQQEQSDQRGNRSDPRGQRADDGGGDNQAWLDQAIEETGMYTRIHRLLSSTQD